MMQATSDPRIFSYLTDLENQRHDDHDEVIFTHHCRSLLPHSQGVSYLSITHRNPARTDWATHLPRLAELVDYDHLLRLSEQTTI